MYLVKGWDVEVSDGVNFFRGNIIQALLHMDIELSSFNIISSKKHRVL